MSAVNNPFSGIKPLINLESEIASCRAEVSRNDKMARLQTINALSSEALTALLDSDLSVDLKKQKVHELVTKLNTVAELADGLSTSISNEITTKKEQIPTITTPKFLERIANVGRRKLLAEKDALAIELRGVQEYSNALKLELVNYKAYDNLNKLFQIALKIPEDERFNKILELRESTLMMLPEKLQDQFLAKITQLMEEGAPPEFLDIVQNLSLLMLVNEPKTPSENDKFLSQENAYRIISACGSAEVRAELIHIFAAPSETSRNQPQELVKATNRFDQVNTADLILKVGRHIAKRNPNDLFLVADTTDSKDRAALLEPLIAFCRVLGPNPLGKQLLAEIEKIPSDQRANILTNMTLLFQNKKSAIAFANELIDLVRQIPKESRDDAVSVIAPQLSTLSIPQLMDNLREFIPTKK
jgi:hypothetical protein